MLYTEFLEGTKARENSRTYAQYETIEKIYNELRNGFASGLSLRRITLYNPLSLMMLLSPDKPPRLNLVTSSSSSRFATSVAFSIPNTPPPAHARETR